MRWWSEVEALEFASLPSGAFTSPPSNINHNLVTEEFWTCGRYNTVNDEVLEYFWGQSQRGSGERTAAAAEGPWSYPPFAVPGALTNR